MTISAPRRSFRWRFPSAEHRRTFFATFYGPTNKALAALGPDHALKTEMAVRSDSTAWPRPP